MTLKELRRAGHWPTLLASFLYFDFSFMTWVTLGPLMIYIARELNIAVADKFTLVAVPILAGAILRVPVGICCDRLGAKVTGCAAQVIVIAAVAYAGFGGLRTVTDIELFGIALGLAGASFAVALPQAGRWYPPHLQGIVMGIAGAGNVGTALDALIIPTLAEQFGWRMAIASLLVPLVPTFLFYAVVSREAPGPRARAGWDRYRAVLTDIDSLWFMFFYFITFGGFVGLANSLSLYFNIQYHVSGVTAGLMVAVVVSFGSFFRPVGGAVADRIGGIRTLMALFGVVSVVYAIAAFLPAGPEPAVAGGTVSGLQGPAVHALILFSAGVLCLGMGNGAVFQLIPQRFRGEIGTMTGLVGCFGGIGGFFLAKALGMSKDLTGGFSAGFLFFSVLVLAGLAALAGVRKRWRTTWGAASGARI
ncbi:MAG: NarK/NasA family nitrate transporter [Telmatospirillum sp.]|nr:NarK/NasA family nitrate transporter [Telmatospirillum sp.]